MNFSEFKEKCKKHASKLVAAVSGGAVMASGAISAFAADTTGTEGVEAAKTMLESITGTLNITNIVAIIVAGIGAVIGIFLAWWGVRKLVKMLMGAFKKGKVTV